MSERMLSYLPYDWPPVDSEWGDTCDTRCRRVRFVHPDTTWPTVGFLHSREAHEEAGTRRPPRRGVVAHAGVEVDLDRSEIRAGGSVKRVKGRRTLEFLSTLAAAGGSAVSHEDLMERLWGKGQPLGSLKTLVHRARLNVAPARIVNVREVGYRLEGP